MERQKSGTEGAYLETPGGIFSASGHWYHTTESSLRAYAGEVLERESLATLITLSDTWLRSPQTLTLWAVPVLLLTVSPLQTSLAALGIYLVWKIVSPAMVSRALAKVLRVLENVYLQGLYYVFTLSVLAAGGNMAAMWTGLAAFILLRWGVLERVADPLIDKVHRAFWPLPPSDQVLRAFIVRTALVYRVSLPELEQMEQDILRRWSKGKS